jgi:hypothetical protein
MQSWRQLGSIWQLRPKQPRGLVEFIGGSYLAATPQVSYRRILEDLCTAGLAIHAWAYVPGFDHQSQAKEAWMAFRQARRQLEDCCGGLPTALRLGHSLGMQAASLGPRWRPWQPWLGRPEFQQLPSGSLNTPPW